MTRRKPPAASIVEEQPPQHGGSFVRQPDGTLEVIEQTVLTGPGEAPADAGEADQDDADQEGAGQDDAGGDGAPAAADGATDPAAPINPDAANTEEA